MVTAELKDKEIQKYMRQLYKKSGNLSGFFKHTAISVIHNSTQMNFRAGGRPRKWKGLSPLTMANRMSRGAVASHALGQNILMNSGGLQKSIGTVRKITKESLEYGTNKIYASMMQYGGTIRPVRVRYLTIPLPASTPGMKARDYENTFVAKGIIFQKQGDGIVPLFILKKQVKIPARPFMVWQPKDIQEIGNNLLIFVTQVGNYKVRMLK